MDATVSHLNESMVAIATGMLLYASNCSRELGQPVIDLSRHSAPPSDGSTTTSVPVGYSYYYLNKVSFVLFWYFSSMIEVISDRTHPH